MNITRFLVDSIAITQLSLQLFNHIIHVFRKSAQHKFKILVGVPENSLELPTPHERIESPFPGSEERLLNQVNSTAYSIKTLIKNTPKIDLSSSVSLAHYHHISHIYMAYNAIRPFSSASIYTTYVEDASQSLWTARKM